MRQLMTFHYRLNYDGKVIKLNPCKWTPIETPTRHAVRWFCCKCTVDVKWPKTRGGEASVCSPWPLTLYQKLFWPESHGTADNRRQAGRLLRFIKKRAGRDNVGSGGFCGHEWVVQLPKDAQSPVLWSVCVCFPELNSGTSRWPAVSYLSAR